MELTLVVKALRAGVTVQRLWLSVRKQPSGTLPVSSAIEWTS
jgi:hypothetical protein